MRASGPGVQGSGLDQQGLARELPAPPASGTQARAPGCCPAASGASSTPHSLHLPCWHGVPALRPAHPLLLLHGQQHQRPVSTCPLPWGPPPWPSPCAPRRARPAHPLLPLPTGRSWEPVPSRKAASARRARCSTARAGRSACPPTATVGSRAGLPGLGSGLPGTAPGFSARPQGFLP